ncbi:hypothetical protein ACFY36_01385 [Actinoplanes sp. NPDC000266]
MTDADVAPWEESPVEKLVESSRSDERMLLRALVAAARHHGIAHDAGRRYNMAYRRAVEAIEIGRRLVAADPTVEADLASALESAAAALATGPVTAEQARPLIDEAVEIRRRHEGLALARSLLVRSAVLDLQREADGGPDMAEALGMLREHDDLLEVAAALTIVLRLSARFALKPDEANTIHRLSSSPRGPRTADDLASLHESLMAYHRYAAAGLARDLLSGPAIQAVARDDLATTTTLRRELAEAAPGAARRRTLVRLLLDRSVELREQGLLAESVATAREAFEAAVLPRDRPIAASVLCESLCALRQGDEALAVADDVVRAAGQSGDPVAPALAISCRAMVLSHLGRHDEAIAAARRTWRMLRKLARADPRLGGHAIEALKGVAFAYECAGKPTRAGFYRTLAS